MPGVNIKEWRRSGSEYLRRTFRTVYSGFAFVSLLASLFVSPEKGAQWIWFALASILFAMAQVVAFHHVRLERDQAKGDTITGSLTYWGNHRLSDSRWVMRLEFRNDGPSSQFWGKGYWLTSDRQEMHTGWEIAWARTADHEMRIGSGAKHQINLLMLLADGFADPIKPSHPQLSTWSDRKQPSIDAVSVGVQLWSSYAQTSFFAAGFRFKVDQSVEGQLVLVRDDSVLPEHWQPSARPS